MLAGRAARRGLELDVAADRPGRDAATGRVRPPLRRRRPGPGAGADRTRTWPRRARRWPRRSTGGAAVARRLRRLPAARPLLPRPLRLGAAGRRGPPAPHRRGRAADDRRRPARVRARARAERDAGRVREPRRADDPRRRRSAARAGDRRASATTVRAGSRAAGSSGSVGTYLHGPLLPRNPWLADWLLAQAVAHRSGGEPPEFEPLDDWLEAEAHAVSAARARARGGRF